MSLFKKWNNDPIRNLADNRLTERERHREFYESVRDIIIDRNRAARIKIEEKLKNALEDYAQAKQKLPEYKAPVTKEIHGKEPFLRMEDGALLPIKFIEGITITYTGHEPKKVPADIYSASIHYRTTRIGGELILLNHTPFEVGYADYISEWVSQGYTRSDLLPDLPYEISEGIAEIIIIMSSGRELKIQFDHLKLKRAMLN